MDAQARVTYSPSSREESARSRLGRDRHSGAHLGQLLPSLSGHLPLLITVHLVSQEKNDHSNTPCVLHREHIPSDTRVACLLCARPWVDLALTSRKLAACLLPAQTPTFSCHPHSTTFPPGQFPSICSEAAPPICLQTCHPFSRASLKAPSPRQSSWIDPTHAPLFLPVLNSPVFAYTGCLGSFSNCFMDNNNNSIYSRVLTICQVLC